MRLVGVFALLVGLAAVLLYASFGTIDPCGVLRARVRAEAVHSGQFVGFIANAMPDSVIDGLIAAQYGPLSPGRCVALLFGGGGQPVAPRAQATQARAQAQVPAPAQTQTAAAEGVVGLDIGFTPPAAGSPRRIVVKRVWPGSPAAAAGIQLGDEIVAVNGQSVFGRSLPEVIQMGRGRVGTFLTLVIRRGEVDHEVVLTRVARQN